MLRFPGYKIETGRENKASIPHALCKVLPLYHSYDYCFVLLSWKGRHFKEMVFQEYSLKRSDAQQRDDICTHLHMKHTHTHTLNVHSILKGLLSTVGQNYHTAQQAIWPSVFCLCV